MLEVMSPDYHNIKCKQAHTGYHLWARKYKYKGGKKENLPSNIVKKTQNLAYFFVKLCNKGY